MKFIYLIFTVLISFSINAKTKKVITLAPNLTDIMYYLNYEKNIIAVDKFSKKPKNAVIIGDLMNINYEKLISLNPDIVFLTKEQENIAEKIKRIKKIKTHIVNIKRLYDINPEIAKIAKLLNIKNKEIPFAPLLSISKAIKIHKKVLIVIDRNKNVLNNLFVVGSDNFMNDYLAILNLNNTIKSKKYPKINIETVINLNPDVIIDLTYGASINIWNKFPQIKAVKNKKVYKGSIKLTIPSPYIINEIIELSKKIR